MHREHHLRLTNKEKTLLLTWFILLLWVYIAPTIMEQFLILIHKDTIFMLDVLYTFLSYLPIVILCIYYRDEVKSYFNFKSILLPVLMCILFLLTLSLRINVIGDADVSSIFSSVMRLLLLVSFEEVFFRGLLYSTWKDTRGEMWGGIISTLLFIFAHDYKLYNGGFMFLTFHIFLLLSLSCVNLYMFKATANLWGSILFHALFNLNIYFALIIIFAFFVFYMFKAYKNKRDKEMKT